MATFVCRVIDDNHVSVNGKQITIVSNRDPTKLPWADMVSPSIHLAIPPHIPLHQTAPSGSNHALDSGNPPSATLIAGYISYS